MYKVDHIFSRYWISYHRRSKSHEQGDFNAMFSYWTESWRVQWIHELPLLFLVGSSARTEILPKFRSRLRQTPHPHSTLDQWQASRAGRHRDRQVRQSAVECTRIKPFRYTILPQYSSCLQWVRVGGLVTNTHTRSWNPKDSERLTWSFYPYLFVLQLHFVTLRATFDWTVHSSTVGTSYESRNGSNLRRDRTFQAGIRRSRVAERRSCSLQSTHHRGEISTFTIILQMCSNRH